MEFNTPTVIFGTSLLGNLYRTLTHPEKLEIVQAYIETCPGTPMFDTAGKYGAGMALEELGKCLKELGVATNEVLISNKLAWIRTPLITPEPTFEQHIWHGLTHDAVQKISYNGILQCFEEGNIILENYSSQFASVHDPDEYLAASKDENDYKKRYDDILDAYRALTDLKKKGVIKGIGIGAKDWQTIEKISKDVQLDWVMLANSFTIYNHPKALVEFVDRLKQAGVLIINSAVFHGGFLMGNDIFNYSKLYPDNPEHSKYFKWRNKFYEVCKEFDLQPAVAAIYFGLHIPGVKSIALNSSNPQRVKWNNEAANAKIPLHFWEKMKQEGLVDIHYPHL